MIETKTHNPEVYSAVESGLTGTPKRLPSWLFYDEIGDKIFQTIMLMPEYYLTDCEFDIFRSQKEKIWKMVTSDHKPFKLVELGAGDGTKTEVLLSYFLEQDIPFSYVPVDVSKAVLDQLTDRLAKTLPRLKIHPENKLYHRALKDLHADRSEKKLIMFLGANIGNFGKDAAIKFVEDLGSQMNDEDLLLIGFDLKKDPHLVRAAYDDPSGITKEFNLNLLSRINREFGGQFDIETFSHYSFYDPESGVTKSYLVSSQEQDIFIAAFDKHIHFERGEVIHTEISQKYDMQMINLLASQSGLEVIDVLYDRQKYFCDVLLRIRT